MLQQLQLNLTITPNHGIPPGELWWLKTQDELGKAPNNSFVAFGCFSEPREGTGGQTYWVGLEQPEIDHVKSLNPFDGEFTTEQKWQWADGSVESFATLYLGHDPDTDTHVRWPRITIGSKDNDNRNMVMVLREQDSFVRLAGIARLANYRLYNFTRTPWLVHHVWCSDWGGQIWETPKGPFFMPIYDPAGGFEISAGADGLWIPADYLYKKVGT